MKLKTAVAKRMRTLALAEQKSPQIAFMPKVDYEKVHFSYPGSNIIQRFSYIISAHFSTFLRKR